MLQNPHGTKLYGNQSIDHLHFVIVGCGAIGSNVAMALVRQGAMRLTLVDYDRVDETNLSTTVYMQMDVGRTKVGALGDLIYSVSPTCVVDTFSVELTAQSWRRIKPLRNTPGGNMVVLDCVDNVTTRRLLQTQLGEHVLHLGINANYCEAVWGSAYKMPDTQPAGLAACDIPYSLNLVLFLTGLTVDALYQYPNKRNMRATLNPIKGY